MSQEFDIEVLDLVKQKEFYPYEYNSSFEKFWKTLSGKNEFYIWPSGKRIIVKEYQYVLNVWDFKWRQWKIALKMWCFIVSWYICRNCCVENHGLCLSHYWNTPASSWDAMLSMTKFELDLISEADVYLFLKKEG